MHPNDGTISTGVAVGIGASSIVVGFYGTFKEILNAVYPYPRGALPDRLGNQATLINLGLVTALGYNIWALAPAFGGFSFLGLSIPGWVWIFIGTIFVLAWKELGLGATFALVREGVPPDRLARGFASTEVFRRVGYLIGPMVASGVLAVHSEFVTGFQFLLVIAMVISLLATYGQFKGYRVAEEYEIFTNDSRSTQKGTLTQLYEDVRDLPVSLKPLLVVDILVRFANGMVYVFYVLVITQYHEVGWSIFGVSLPPASFFGFSWESK